MNWPWRRRRSTDTESGRVAREQAEQKLAETQAQTPYYQRLAEESQRMRERNHWGETIAAIARKERPT
jgi:hypothetical protein